MRSARLLALAALLAGCGGSGGLSTRGWSYFGDFQTEQVAAGTDTTGKPLVAFYDPEAGVVRVLRGGSQVRIPVTAGDEGPRPVLRAAPEVRGALAYVIGDWVVFAPADGGEGDTYLLNVRTQRVVRRAGQTIGRGGWGDASPLASGSRVIWVDEEGETPGYVLEDLATGIRKTIALPADATVEDFAGDRLLVSMPAVGARRRPRADVGGRSAVYSTAGQKLTELEESDAYATSPECVNARGEAFGQAYAFSTERESFGCARWSASGAMTVMPVGFDTMPVGLGDDGTALAVADGSVVAWPRDGAPRFPAIRFAGGQYGDIPRLSRDGRTIFVFVQNDGDWGYRVYRGW